MKQINRLQKRIENLKSDNLYRKLTSCQNLPNNEVMIDGRKYLSFCSNDYLSLAFNEEIQKITQKAIEKYGSGGLSSRYIYGDNELYQKLEEKISQMNQKDSAIIFGSGYLTNIGVIPALCNKSDLILADKLSHSCLIDGAKLSGSKFTRFAHNNLESLENLLKKHRNNHQKCLIITETIFSMDGNLGKINEIIAIAKKYDCFLLTDNAHGLGVINEKYDKYNLHLKVGTFSKSCSGYGGYVCADKIIIDYLRNFSKSAIYSTALPPAILANNLKALEIIEKGNLTKKLWENIDYFCDLMNIKNQESAIIPIIIGDARKTLEFSGKLKEKGFLVSAIRPPTVAIGKSRLRITITASHKKSNLKILAKNIHKYNDYIINRQL
jgi:8-amino-7-oxononanoate synthase